MGVFTLVERETKCGMCVLGGIGLGAGLMYILDPDRGRRRRATAHDKLNKMMSETGKVLDQGLRDLNNRVSGAVMAAVSTVAPRAVSDDVLAGRVRAGLGRL